MTPQSRYFPAQPKPPASPTQSQGVNSNGSPSGVARVKQLLGGIRGAASRGEPSVTPLSERGATAIDQPAILGGLVTSTARGLSTFREELARIRSKLIASIGRESPTDRQVDACLRALIATEAGRSGAQELATLILDMTIAIGECAESHSQTPELAADVQLARKIRGELVRVASASPAMRGLTTAIDALEPDPLVGLVLMLNRAKVAAESGGGDKPVQRFLTRFEEAIGSRTTVDQFLRSNIAAQGAMALSSGNSTSVTVDLGDGGPTAPMSVPIFRELDRDIPRMTGLTVRDVSGAVTLALSKKGGATKSERPSPEQEKASALQRIFVDVARKNPASFQQVSRWCQQGLWAFLPKVMETSNSPFKLPDRTPACFTGTAGDLYYDLAPQLNGDVLLTSRIEYKPRSIAPYYRMSQPDLAVEPPEGSFWTAELVIRIKADGENVLVDRVTFTQPGAETVDRKR